MRKLVVAIDGPAGAGKSTVAQIVAQRLSYTYIDTGAMYRAVAWKALQLSKLSCDEIAKIAEDIDIKLNYVNGKTFISVDECDVTEAIRTREVTQLVAEVAQIAAVRKHMLTLQRQMAEAGGVVMDGRDIATHVLPNADVKVFLTASIEERALRRWREMTNKGFTVDLEQLKAEIECRDKKDCERDLAPLIQAEDATLVDTTKLSIEGAVDTILELCSKRRENV
ncbi:(d)CMP kinase [Dendrosporobacter sp. 1207_IL3150]|uniref:(d)CMP kinase n=1 Tax=Dendrosporobacter sp. 1207_IL3150 TaxID=3084054 RepID=UPI002FD8F7DB